MTSSDALPLRRKLGLAAEVLFAYVHARRLLRRHDLPHVLRELRRPPGGRPAAAAVADDRLARAVTRTLRALPADSRCLMQSLVLTRLLARRGRSARLVIGVSPTGAFTAHAWVEREGAALLPTHGEAFARLTEL